MDTKIAVAATTVGVGLMAGALAGAHAQSDGRRTYSLATPQMLGAGALTASAALTGIAMLARHARIEPSMTGALLLGSLGASVAAYEVAAILTARA